jgi:hypothetical protein
VPVQLSPVRDALRAFGDVDVPSRITAALFAAVALDVGHRRLDEAQLLRVLSDVRRLAGCPPSWASTIADYEAAAMLAATAPHGPAPTAGELLRWLDEVRGPAHFLVSCRDRREAAAFVAAVSAALAVDAGGRGKVTFEGPSGSAWLIGIDERAWRVARDRLGPLPLASTVPYPGDPSGQALVEGARLQGVGADVVEPRLAALERRHSRP